MSETLDFSEYSGRPAKDVELELKKLYPTYSIACFDLDDLVTADYRTDRLRIWQDPEGNVVDVACG